MAFARYSKSDLVIAAVVPVRIIATMCFAIFACGCAAPDTGRDARGNPRIDRLTEEQVARLTGSSPALTAEERARQTGIINAQVGRETAEAEQRKADEARNALARQRALQNRRHDPHYGDPHYGNFYGPWAGMAWPGYWGWRWNYPPRNGIGIFWRGR